jgi:DNA-binding NarL/FixJ family response regulator
VRPCLAPANSRKAARNDGPVRVMICDDEPGLRMLLRIALGLEPDLEVVAEAANGREAIDLAKQHRPDVILLDLAMPVMDGLEALPKLRAVAPETKVVVFSGFQESLFARKARELGADAYVEKGVDPSTVADAIRTAAA